MADSTGSVPTGCARTTVGALTLQIQCPILDFVDFQVWERDRSMSTMWLEVLHEFRPDSSSQSNGLHTAGEGTVSTHVSSHPCSSHLAAGGELYVPEVHSM